MTNEGERIGISEVFKVDVWWPKDEVYTLTENFNTFEATQAYAEAWMNDLGNKGSELHVSVIKTQTWRYTK